MKLKQVNEGQKCPKCKKYTLVQSQGYKMTSENTAIMWGYFCTNCDAKFIDEDLIKKLRKKK